MRHLSLGFLPLALVVLSTWILSPQLVAGSKTKQSLICINGSPTESINLRVGDMLQIRPFEYPVTPDFMGATLNVRMDGGRCLEQIGQSSALPEGKGKTEGHGGRVIFLWVLAPGETSLAVRLLNQKGQNLRSAVTYRILVSAQPW